MKTLLKLLYNVCEGLNTVLVNTLKVDTTPTGGGEKEDLRKYWIIFLSRYDDDTINKYLAKCNLYNYDVKVDGRNMCVNKLVDYNTRNNYSPYYLN